MLALIDTPLHSPVVAPKTVTLGDVAVILRDIQINQETMCKRMARMETRLVNLMITNGLDRNGKRGAQR